MGDVMDFEQFEEVALMIGLAAIMGFMMFIIYDLGMVGFIIKGVLKLTMGI